VAAPTEVPVFSGQPLWHTLTLSQALDAAGVAEQQGLSSTEAAARAQCHGDKDETGSVPGRSWLLWVMPAGSRGVSRVSCEMGEAPARRGIV